MFTGEAEDPQTQLSRFEIDYPTGHKIQLSKEDISLGSGVNRWEKKPRFFQFCFKNAKMLHKLEFSLSIEMKNMSNIFSLVKMACEFYEDNDLRGICLSQVVFPDPFIL